MMNETVQVLPPVIPVRVNVYETKGKRESLLISFRTDDGPQMYDASCPVDTRNAYLRSVLMTVLDFYPNKTGGSVTGDNAVNYTWVAEEIKPVTDSDLAKALKRCKVGNTFPTYAKMKLSLAADQLDALGYREAAAELR